MNKRNTVIMILLVSIVSDFAWCEKSDLDFKIGPVTFDTGIRTGLVIDAMTGEPVEGAVVTYMWDVKEPGLESHSRLGASYEAITDNEGKYHIPSQSVKSEFGDLAYLKPEDVIVYKFGYTWYRVHDNKARSFVVYISDLVQKYRREGNIVRLQPWINELSHSEHVGLLTSMSFNKRPELKKELEEELILAKRERKANEPFEEKVKKAKSKLREDKRAYQKSEITKEEYISRLNGYLCISDAELLRLTSLALKEFDGNLSDLTIPVLIEFLKNNVYRASAFSTAIGTLGVITCRSDLKNTTFIPERLEVVEEIEQWWQRNKDRNKSEWFGDLFLNARTYEAKLAALNALGQIGNKSVVPYLVQGIAREGETAILYEMALRLLAKFGDEPAISHIKKMLYHEDVYVRREAALALHRLGDQSGVPIMIASLEAESLNTRSVASAVLREVTGQDFTESKSFRHLSPDNQKGAIEKWKVWWQQNKNSINAGNIMNFSVVLERDKEAMDKRYAAILDAEKDNPNFPVFADQNDSPIAFFEQFKIALAANDINKAVSYFSPHLRERCKKIYQQLGAHCRDYAESMGPLYFESRMNNQFRYEMLAETDEGLFSFPVHFIQIGKGKWWIQQL